MGNGSGGSGELAVNSAEKLQKLEWQRDVIIGFQAQGILTWGAMQEALTVINTRIHLIKSLDLAERSWDGRGIGPEDVGQS